MSTVARKRAYSVKTAAKPVGEDRGSRPPVKAAPQNPPLVKFAGADPGYSSASSLAFALLACRSLASLSR